MPNSIRFHIILHFFVTADFISGSMAFLQQCDSDKIMFHSTLRREPEAFYRIRTLKGVCGYSLKWGQGVKPSVKKNGFRAFHRANMSPQDTQVNNVGCVFLPKTKLNTIRHYTCDKLHAHA